MNNSSYMKKVYIAISVLLLAFVVVFIVAFVTHKKNEQVSLDESSKLIAEDYATNETKPRQDNEKEEETAATTETQIKVVDSVSYENLENLTNEQQADKSSMFTLFRDSVAEQESLHGRVISAKVLPNSNEGLTYVSATFADNTSQEYVLLYDEYTRHSFLNCQTKEVWDYFHDGNTNLG